MTDTEARVAISPGHGDSNQTICWTDPETGAVTYFGAPPADGEALAPCPFCGCDYADTEAAAGLEVCNTHTPSFWIRCNACGAEHHANDHEFPNPVELSDGRLDYTAEMFVQARAAAVAAWNTRDERWRTRNAEEF